MIILSSALVIPATECNLQFMYQYQPLACCIVFDALYLPTPESIE